jgi:peptidoglycan hydrolase-like protein with peptidoglycan-binding domain
MLISWGFLQAAASGYYGELTAHAVATYQGTHGLIPTGIVDAPTRALLNQGIL